jgi:beta-phosphoglucomutase-like phosphatase (HAD superfamily)
VLALGTGRTLRAAVAQVSAMERPQHKIVSLVGNFTRDGRASPYNVAMRLCDRTGAQCYPLPTPVVADDIEQRKLLQSQRWYATMVVHGKPAPDLFLLAAKRMKAEPAQCIVVEDSIHGVRAGKAAGMTILGFIGGSHIRGNAARERSHSEKLIQAGATMVFDKLADLPELVREFSR